MASLTVRYGLFQSVVALYICGTKEHNISTLFSFYTNKKNTFLCQILFKNKSKGSHVFWVVFFFCYHFTAAGKDF